MGGLGGCPIASYYFSAGNNCSNQYDYLAEVDPVTCSLPQITLDLGVPKNHFGYIQASNGNNYAGISSIYARTGCGTFFTSATHGKISIKLSKKLKKCKSYKLTLDIAKMGVSTKTPKVKIYLSKNANGNDKQKIEDNLSISNTQWQEYTYTFSPEDDEIEYLFIESSQSTKPFSQYFSGTYIDNLSLIDLCDPSYNCSVVSDCIYPSFILNGLFGVFNIDNVKNANIWIFNSFGQLVRTISINSTNGITYPIYWDGKLENGNYVATGNYSATLELTNDCGTKNFNKNFTLLNWSNSPIILYDSYYTGPVKIPRPCCAGIQDYYLSNVVLEAPYEWNYVIYGNLYLNNVTIQPGAIVNFQAGGDIYSGFTEITALPGVESFQYNTQCTQQRIYNDDGEEINWVGNEQERLANTEIYNWPQINNEVIIYPNPSNGIFNIVCSNNELFNLEVFSLQGTKILVTEFQGNHSLNLSHLNKGIYLVKIHGNDIMHTQKIIIQ